jgi:hypothetical protein
MREKERLRGYVTTQREREKEKYVRIQYKHRRGLAKASAQFLSLAELFHCNHEQRNELKQLYLNIRNSTPIVCNN